MRRPRPWSIGLFAASALSLAPLAGLSLAPAAFADEEKPAKVDRDDASAFKDWGFCKNRGVKHNRDRAEYWEKKGVEGKDLQWLGNMWDRGQEHGKAAATWLKFLEWSPPPEAQSAYAKNRPVVAAKMPEVLFRAKEWDKSLAAGERFRAEFPDEAKKNAYIAWAIPGHAARMAGDEAKAIALFTEAAQNQSHTAVLDLVDVHLAAGRVDEAKAVLATFGEGATKGVKELAWAKDVVGAVGTAQVTLEEAKSVGTTEAPAAFDRATLMYHWAMQTSSADQATRSLEILRRSVGDGLTVLGVATYKKFDPEAKKVVADLSEERELEFYRRMIADTFITPQPGHVVVPQAWLDRIHLKWDRQVVIVDRQGILRWARLVGEKPWDYTSMELAARQLSK